MATMNSSTTAPTSTTPTAAAVASGQSKKGKLKGKTVDLTEFLNKPISWAEEMEEMPLTPADPDHGSGYGDNYTTTIEVRTEIIQKRSQLPTAPKAALSTTVDPNRVPLTPPFSAYVGNVSYNANEDDIIRFFKGLRIISVKLMRDGGRVKGFGYIEFESREDLLEALAMDKQRLLNRELKIDLADRPEERPQQQRMGTGGRQQRMGSGYDSDKGRDRQSDSVSDWRGSARPTAGPPSPYDDRRSQPRTGAPPMGQMQPSQPAYAYRPPAGQTAGPPPSYGPPPHAYGRHPEGYPPQQYQRAPSGYESDYSGGRGYGGGYDNYPVMRQASYSSQYSGYASDREGGNYRRGGIPGPGYYGSMRREHRGGDRYQPGHPSGGHRYPPGEGYNAQPYQTSYNQSYQEGYGRQRGRGGYQRGGGPDMHRDQYGYEPRSSYSSGGGRRTEDRLSSVDTADGKDTGAEAPKERPRLALQPRTLPLPDAKVAPANGPEPIVEERPRTVVPAAQVFGGARPVDTSAREREVEEKLRKQQEEFRRQEEERKQEQQQQQQQQGDHPRKSVSSAAGPERVSTGSRRRTSDSQCSSGSQTKSMAEHASKTYEDASGGHMKILQRSQTMPTSVTSDSTVEPASNAESHYDRDQQQQQRPPVRPAQQPSQNYWTSQGRHRGDKHANQNNDPGSLPEKQASRSDAQVEQAPSNVSNREISQSKSDAEVPEEENYEDDAVFKPHRQQHPSTQQRHTLYPARRGGGGYRGGRGGGRGGGGYYHQDSAPLPPRFARERDQQSYQRRGSSQTDDGQEQYNDRRRASKEIVIRRGGQGTLSPAAMGGRRGGAPAGLSGRPQHRVGSRERDYRQKGNDRRQQQRRGSADFTTENNTSKQQEEVPKQEAAKPPMHPRRSQQGSAPGSRKSSVTPAAVVADPPPVSFESRNKFEMLDMEDD